MRKFEGGKRYYKGGVTYEIVKGTAKMLTYRRIQHAGKFNERIMDKKIQKFTTGKQEKLFLRGAAQLKHKPKRSAMTVRRNCPTCADDGRAHDERMVDIMTKAELIEKIRKDRYPYRIKGNGGYEAVLYGIQPLLGGEYEAIYRYPGSTCCHDLEEIKAIFEVVEQ